ncbi:hypothetical protein Fmac_002854 [Flemingia macrophylla]|uniref:Uncharacterized protein n=1 Tax=Flemingia macrophylla TaxID=520843 RepID=A0ABD1NL34_9FABA
MENDDECLFMENWDPSMIEELAQLEARLTSSSSSFSRPPPQPPPSSSLASFSPPRELSQRPPRSPSPPFHSKDLQINRLKQTKIIKDNRGVGVSFVQGMIEQLVSQKDLLVVLEFGSLGYFRHIFNGCPSIETQRELEHATEKIANLLLEILVRVKCWDFGTIAPNCHKIPSKIQNEVSSKDLNVETAFKAKGIETDKNSDQEAQGALSDDLLAYADLSQKLLAIWGSPTDKKMGNNVISKLLVGCQRDFHILFGCLNMGLPSGITRELLSDLSSSGATLHHLKDRFHAPESAQMSNLYLALTKIADGTDVLETLIEPLIDLCGMETVVIVHSSLCVLHMLLKLLLELEKNVGRSVEVTLVTMGGSEVWSVVIVVDLLEMLVLCTLLRENVFIEGLYDGKDLVDSGVEDGNLYNEEIASRKEDWNHQNSLKPHVNWIYLFEIMHQIATRITEERVRVKAVSIMELLFLRSNAYFERDQFSQKIVFKTISELLKKDAALAVKKHALRLLYLVLNCPKLLAAFCCGCKEGDNSSVMDDNEFASDIQNFKIILQGLSDCVASNRGGILELKVSRNAIVVLAFLSSSGQPGFEILVSHRLSSGGVNYLMLILQLLVSEMDLEAEAFEQQPEIFRERTFLIREILILLNRLVSSPSYSATVLRGLTSTRDMAGLTIDVASRLSRKAKKNEQQDSMVNHIRETEIVDLARLFKKRVFTYLGDDLS